MEILYNYFFDIIFKMYKKLLMSDNPFSQKVLEGRKPIEVLKHDLDEIKLEMVHIKSYLKKLEARESVKEDKEKKLEASYEKVEKKGWLW
tara:strand:+ start:282 stop:551 length:270 start_codon:yes stop_codon:yes gene_type:complete